MNHVYKLLPITQHYVPKFRVCCTIMAKIQNVITTTFFAIFVYFVFRLVAKIQIFVKYCDRNKRFIKTLLLLKILLIFFQSHHFNWWKASYLSCFRLKQPLHIFFNFRHPLDLNKLVINSFGNFYLFFPTT